MQSTSDASAEADPRPTVRSSLRRMLRGLMQARLSESLNSTRSSVSRGVDHPPEMQIYTMSEGDHDQFKKNFVDGLQEDIRTQLRQAINAKVVSEKPAREDRAFPMLHMYIESNDCFCIHDIREYSPATRGWHIREARVYCVSKAWRFPGALPTPHQQHQYRRDR